MANACSACGQPIPTAEQRRKRDLREAKAAERRIEKRISVLRDRLGVIAAVKASAGG